MQIAEDTVVALRYELFSADGELIDGTFPLAGRTLHFACTVAGARREGRSGFSRPRARRARASSLMR